MDLGKQKHSGYQNTVQQMFGFGCSKSAWVGAVPEAATPALAWPPSLCPCPLRRRASRLSGCSVRGDRLGSARAGAGKVGSAAGRRDPPTRKVEAAGAAQTAPSSGLGFLKCPLQGGTGKAWQVPGPWRAGLARRPGAASRCPLAVARQGSPGPRDPAVSRLGWAAAPRSAACFVF